MRSNCITKRISLALLAGMFCLLTVLIGYIWRIAADARKESRDYALSLSDTMTASLTEKTATIAKAASSLAQNTYVEDYFNSDDITSRATSIRIFNSFAANAIHENKDILAVSLIDRSGTTITVGLLLDAVVLSNLERSYPCIREEGSFKPFFTRAILLEGRLPYYAYVMPVYDTTNPTPMTRLATCVVLCDLRVVQSVLDQQLTEPFCDIRLRGIDDLLLSDRTAGRIAPYAQTEVITHPIAGSNWNISYTLDFSSFSFGERSLSVLWVMALICAVMLLCVALIIRMGLARPLDLIIARLRSEKDLSDLGLRFNNEMDIIVDTIQHTFARLEKSTQERIRSQTEMYAMQLHLKESELSALQSQINPHFLYNTLECLRSIGLYYNSPEIVTISTAMADIFRYSIKGAPMVTLETELTIIRQYLDIIHVRFDGRFTPVYDVLPETLSCIIPKMTLQPVVENAIYHGLEPKKGRGIIVLRARLRGGDLILSVEDDGLGMSPEDLAHLNERLSSPDAPIDLTSTHRSVGLSNIAQRIRLFAKGQCSVEVHSKQNEGTSVCLRLPARMESDSQK